MARWIIQVECISDGDTAALPHRVTLDAHSDIDAVLHEWPGADEYVRAQYAAHRAAGGARDQFDVAVTIAPSADTLVDRANAYPKPVPLYGAGGWRKVFEVSEPRWLMDADDRVMGVATAEQAAASDSAGENGWIRIDRDGAVTTARMTEMPEWGCRDVWVTSAE